MWLLLFTDAERDGRVARSGGVPGGTFRGGRGPGGGSTLAGGAGGQSPPQPKFWILGVISSKSLGNSFTESCQWYLNGATAARARHDRRHHFVKKSTKDLLSPLFIHLLAPGQLRPVFLPEAIQSVPISHGGVLRCDGFVVCFYLARGRAVM